MLSRFDARCRTPRKRPRVKTRKICARCAAQRETTVRRRTPRSKECAKTTHAAARRRGMRGAHNKDGASVKHAAASSHAADDARSARPLFCSFTATRSARGEDETRGVRAVARALCSKRAVVIILMLSRYAMPSRAAAFAADCHADALACRCSIGPVALLPTDPFAFSAIFHDVFAILPDAGC